MPLTFSFVLLALVEALVLYLAWLGGYALALDGQIAQPEPAWLIWLQAAGFSFIVLACLFSVGLFSARQRARFRGVVLRLAIATAMGGLLAAALLSWLPPHTPVGVAAGWAALVGFLGIAASRFVLRGFLDSAVFKRRVLVYGAGNMAESLVNLRRRSDRRGFEIVGFVRVNGESAAGIEALSVTPNGLLSLCQRQRVDEIVVAMDDRRQSFPLSELLDCRLSGIDVTELVSFLERETGRVRIDVLNPSWMIFGRGFRRDQLTAFASRTLDIVVSFGVLVVSIPVMLATALAIKVESGFATPVLYRARRVGRRSREFLLFKFRSMRGDGDDEGSPSWAQKDDPRITGVGALIRRLRIDELPQVVNVLRGEMSFVGPRPEHPAFVARFEEQIPYYAQRHSVKPGITGWAQLCYPYGSSVHDAVEKLQYDLYYVKNKSLWFDLSILVQTVEVVLLGKGVR
jgi:sugar transferase (PEP-CTERM system associated)